MPCPTLNQDHSQHSPATPVRGTSSPFSRAKRRKASSCSHGTGPCHPARKRAVSPHVTKEFPLMSWHYYNTTTLSGKLRFLPSSPPSQENGHFMQAKGSDSRRDGLCLKTTGENQNNPAGIKIPANAPSRGGRLLSCSSADQERSCPKTFPRMRGSVGMRGAGDTLPSQHHTASP